MRWLRVVLAVTALAAAPAEVQAQDAATPDAGDRADAEARALFEQGREALARGHYEAALESFRASYELSGRPALLFNIGVAADRLRHDAEALEAFEAYLERVPDAPNRADAEARMQVLRRQLAEDEARLSPDAAARTVVPATETPPPLEEPPDEAPAAYETWWFWTAVGAVVAGGAVAVALAVSGGDGVQEPLSGDHGAAIATLRGTGGIGW